MATTKKKNVRRHRRVLHADRIAHYDAIEAAEQARAERETAAKERKDLAIAAAIHRVTSALEEYAAAGRAQLAAGERRAQEMHEAQLEMMRNGPILRAVAAEPQEH